MSLCKRCALNGDRREGGDFGVCKLHAKARCRFFDCKAKTLGHELCAAHTHQAELARWKAKANLRIVDPEEELDLEEIRHEKLMQAKFHAHEAVEIFFRSIHLTIQAIWGSPEIPSEPEIKRRVA